MRSRWVLLLGLLIALSVAVASAEEPSVGKISEVNGTVWLVPAGATDKDKKQVVVGQEVREGDTIVTDAGSTAKVDFADTSEMKVGEKSKCAIRKKGATLKTPTKLHLFTGKMRVKVKVDRVARGMFEISTPTSVAGVRGSDILTEHIEKITKYVVFRGRLAVWNVMDEAGKSVTVPPKHMTRVGPSVSPEKPVKLDQETLKKLDQAFSMAEKKTEQKKEVASKKKKEQQRGKKEETAGKEPEKKEEATTAGEPAPADETTTEEGTEESAETPTEVVSTEVLEEMSGDASTEVMNEEVQELVQEEVQEVSAERLPDPPGPPSE